MKRLISILENKPVGGSVGLSPADLGMKPVEFHEWVKANMRYASAETSNGIRFSLSNPHQESETGDRLIDVVFVTRDS